MFPPAIVSGGQTGADRAALDFAIARNIPHHGWCPRGRSGEDGWIPQKYLLHETPEADPRQRTEWNVRDSDGTVIFSMAETLSGGTAFTREMALSYGKPLLELRGARSVADNAAALRQFLAQHKIKTLNVAGPKASEEPGIENWVREILETEMALPPSKSLP
jgi:hypothetical protein